MPKSDLLSAATLGDREAQYYYWVREFTDTSEESEKLYQMNSSNFYSRSPTEAAKFAAQQKAEQEKWKNASEAELTHAAQSGDQVALAALARLKGGQTESRRSALISYLEKSAAQEFPPAEMDLATHYLGMAGWTGIKINQQAGLDYLGRAADQGLAGAQYQLGMIYLEGKLLPPDITKCIAYLRRAAAQAGPRSEYQLAQIYANGFGTPRDAGEEPVALLRKSASQNYWPAWRALAERYRTGVGVPKDFIRAARCYRLAEAGRMEDQSASGDYHSLDSIPDGEQPNISPEFKPFARALGYYRQATEQKNPVAMELIGDWYARGRILPQDLVQAYRWYDSAAKQGAPAAAAKRDSAKAKFSPHQIERAQNPADASELPL